MHNYYPTEMDFDIGVLPADVLRLILQQLNWTTACALTLTCTYWYKQLHEYLLHPTITAQSSAYLQGNRVVIHKGRFLHFGFTRTSEHKLYWYEAEFARISDIPPFITHLEDILCGRVTPTEDPKPTRRPRQRDSPYDDGVMIITRTDGTFEHLVYKEHDASYARSNARFGLLHEFLEKTIQEALPSLNTSTGHCITVMQCLGGSNQSKLELDDEGNLRWTTSGQNKRKIQTKYPLKVYHNLKKILLSDKKHTFELTEKPAVDNSRPWLEQVLFFTACYAIDEKQVYTLEKFIRRDKSKKVVEELTVHREKMLKLFIKELSALFNEETCLYSKFFFANHRTGRLQSGPAPWQTTAFEPRLSVNFLKVNRVVPIANVTLSSNHERYARRGSWKWRYLEVKITYLGECTIERANQPVKRADLDFEMTRQFLFDLFSYAVKKDPKNSNINIEPYGPVTNISVSTRPSRIHISIEGVRFCWAWMLKNVLTEPYPAFKKSDSESNKLNAM